MRSVILTCLIALLLNGCTSALGIKLFYDGLSFGLSQADDGRIKIKPDPTKGIMPEPNETAFKYYLRTGLQIVDLHGKECDNLPIGVVCLERLKEVEDMKKGLTF